MEGRLLELPLAIRQEIFPASRPYLHPLRTTQPPAAFHALEEAVVELSGMGKLSKVI